MLKSKKTLSGNKGSGFGRAVIASLHGWEHGDPITVRQVAEIPQPRLRNCTDVRHLRMRTLGVSQAVFARLLGVSPKLVEAWESGRNVPAPPICRLFELIERDPAQFLNRYVKGAA